MPVTLLSALALTQAFSLPTTVPARFYNRPGASSAARDADLARCRAISVGPMGDDTRPAVVQDRRLTPPIGTASEQPRPIAQPVDAIADCMSDHGWRLYALSARDQRTWLRLAPTARARLADTLVGASVPRWGQLIRPAVSLRLTRR